MKRVLVVDDCDLMRELFSEILSCAGAEVILADGSPSALQAFRKEQTPDIVLLDWVMPGGGGEIFVDSLSDEERQKTRIVVVSGYARDSLSLPDDVEFLEKPVFARDLLSMLSSERAGLS